MIVAVPFTTEEQEVREKVCWASKSFGPALRMSIEIRILTLVASGRVGGLGLIRFVFARLVDLVFDLLPENIAGRNL
jgi:hypothetical protein